MNLLSVEELDKDTVLHLLEEAYYFSGTPRGADLENKLILNLFFENSTRTLASFEIATKRLSGEVVTFPLAQSSQKKGESLRDTALTLNALRPDCVIVRHNTNGTAEEFAQWFDCPIINAGDGTNQHPTQALLDLFTLSQKWGDVAGRKIVICGDVKHSRVAKANAQLLSKMGAEVCLTGPAALLPDDWGMSVSEDFGASLKNADAVMMLRVQNERMQSLEPLNLAAYVAQYCLTEARLALAKPEAWVLHPGPLNRGVEIIDVIADSPRSLILQQVANGIPVRQAVLKWLLA